ncbi:MAG: hypothetical protein AABY80_04575 [Candidatus Deferrimicrobiota bacterium]
MALAAVLCLEDLSPLDKIADQGDSLHWNLFRLRDALSGNARLLFPASLAAP